MWPIWRRLLQVSLSLTANFSSAHQYPLVRTDGRVQAGHRAAAVTAGHMHHRRAPRPLHGAERVHVAPVQRQRDTVAHGVASSLQLGQAEAWEPAPSLLVDAQTTEGVHAPTLIREDPFFVVAAAHGERKGLTYEAWRSIGVEPRVLNAAGIGR